MKYKTIIFDLDQTLILHDYSDEDLKLANALQIPYTDKFAEQYSNLITSYTTYCSGKQISEDLIISASEELVPIIKDYSISGAKFLEVWRSMENAIYSQDSADILSYLKVQSYSIVALTDWFTKDQARALERFGYLPYFDKIYGWDDSYCKPDIRALERIVPATNKQDYILVGDSLDKDILCANLYGIDSIWFNPKKEENSSSIVPTYTVSNIFDIKKYV